MPPKPERRPQIIKAAAKLFRARGYQATSMDEVAAKLRLNKATVYHHFRGGKPDLLFQIYKTALDEMTARADAIDVSASAADRLRQYIGAMVSMQVERPDESVVYFQERPWLSKTLSKSHVREVVAAEDHVSGLIRQAIADGVADGSFADVDPGLAAVSLMSMASTTYRWYSPKGSATLDDVVEFYADLMMGGLIAGNRTAPARRRRTALKS